MFRVKRDDAGLHIEKFDPANQIWKEGPNSLLRYVIGGEVGADQISETKANEIILQLSAKA